MKLSGFFKKNEVERDGEFLYLGRADSNSKSTLAYCDTTYYVEMADKNNDISCVITRQEHVAQINHSKGVVVSFNPRKTFYELHNHLLNNKLIISELEYGVGENCRIHPSAVISERTNIGDNVTIAENVVIKDEVVIGCNTFIDAGAVIGSEGLLYVTEKGKHSFVKHAGGVKIGENVFILSNAVIVRSIHGSLFTVIGDGSIVAMSSTIGHEAQIGKNCVISGNCVIARRAHIEDGVWIGSSVVIREYVRVGRQAQVKAGSVVISDVEASQAVSGNFAMDHQKNFKNYLKRQRE